MRRPCRHVIRNEAYLSCNIALGVRDTVMRKYLHLELIGLLSVMIAPKARDFAGNVFWR